MSIGARPSAAAMAVQTPVHWFWCDVDAHCGSDDHVLHPGGLLSPPFPRPLLPPSPGPLPDVGSGCYRGVVGGVAAGVHEVTGTGELWRPKAGATATDANSGAREGRGLGTVSRDRPWHYPQFHRQWNQHDRDAICAKAGVAMGPEEIAGPLPWQSVSRKLSPWLQASRNFCVIVCNVVQSFLFI